MGENKVTFYDICNNLYKLNDGTYSNDTGINIKINENSYGVTSYINSKNLDFYIDLHRNGEYDLTLKLDSNAVLHQSEGFRGRISNWIYLKRNDDTFCIHEDGISKNNEEKCFIKDSELIKKIDNNIYIGYDLENYDSYLYLKKYTVLRETDNLNQDYRKILYCTTLKNEIKSLNESILEAINSFDSSLFKELASILLYRLKEDYSTEMDSLKELADIYNEYKDEFNILDKEDSIRDIYEFTDRLTNQSKQTNIQNLIENIDLNNIESLKNIKNNIDEFIKEKENNIKKKTK